MSSRDWPGQERKLGKVKELGMDYCMMRCCTTPIFLRQYETSTNALMEAFNIGIEDPKGFNCCGYPLRDINFRAYVLASAKNLAIAARSGRNIMTFCNCCYGTLKHVNHLLRSDPRLLEEVNTVLQKEGLRFEPFVEICHVLELLYRDIGIDAIRERIRHRFEGLKIAVHYGCHVLRPGEILEFDSPLVPSIFDELVSVTGAEVVEWSLKLDCCGAPVRGVNDDLSRSLLQRKLESAHESGADALCVACSYCQLQFDRARRLDVERSGADKGVRLPSILYTQLLGLCLGLDEDAIGLGKNEIEVGIQV
jgi:heterodisulfide reductase subunit B